MSRRAQADPREMLVTLGRSWGWILLFGVVTLIVGVMTVAWPGRTIVVVAVLVGLQLFVSGIFRLVLAFTEEAEGHRIWWVIVGLLSVVVGILCLKNVFQTIAALTLILGIFWVVQGIVEFFGGIVGAPERRGWTIFMGIVGFIAGVVVLTYPLESVLAVAWVFGIWLIVYGIMQIMLTFRVKKLTAGGAMTPAAA